MAVIYGSILPIFLTILLSFFLFISLGCGCDPSDRAALLAFSKALKSPLWPAGNGSTRTDCCRWVGVRCAGSESRYLRSSGGVSRLDLGNMMLEGPVSGSLGSLGQLKYLNLSRNHLSGPIPEKLFKLRYLSVIDLSYNNLHGPLSSRIGKLVGLNILNVSWNSISGFIPDAFHQLKQLEYIRASSNMLTGPLPVSLSFCSQLRGLDVGNNSLSGRIDVNFTGLLMLEVLVFSSNSFTGRIPNSISFCTSLIVLDVRNNRFDGSIPWGFRFPGSLQELFLSGNNFSNITRMLSALKACRDLTLLVIGENFKGEEMPDDGIVGYENLKALRVRNCELSGVIPSWISKSKKLSYLDLSGNRLTGEIPLFLTQLKGLMNDTPISLVFYRLEGFYTFPFLDLSSNLLYGETWKLLGNLSNLVYLNLSCNSFSGSIPDSFSNLQNLELLDLSSNQISGTIPSSLKQLYFLSRFNVAHNNLHGYVPSGAQFSTFPLSSFDGNPGLCFSGPGCYPPSFNSPNKPTQTFEPTETLDPKRTRLVVMGFPYAVGVLIGFAAMILICGINRGWILRNQKERKNL